MRAQLHQLMSRAYFWDRARAGKVGRDRDIRERESVFHSERSIVDKLQLEKLNRLLHHAGQHVPYYRDLFRKIGFDSDKVESVNALLALPVLDKAAIRAAGCRMISQAFPRSSLMRNASGGSTGAPMQFYEGENYRAESLVIAPLFDMWTGWRRGERVALLWGAPTDIARYGSFRGCIRTFLQNRFLVDAFDMSEEKLERAVSRIQRRRPALVVAYASAAYLVAQFMEDRNIKLEHPPRALIASAEVLWPHYRTLIESRFGCKVFNRYGSREVGLLAMECAQGNMHINSTGIILEVENPSESSVGALLVTQLDNLAFPFIRYRIGDLGCVRDFSCSCGRALPVLTELQGRVGDYVTAPDGTIIHGEWFTHLFYDVPGVVLFTFRQTETTRYVLSVQRGIGFRAEDFDRVLEKAQRKLGSRGVIKVIFVERFEPTRSGKHHFVINEVAALAKTV